MREQALQMVSVRQFRNKFNDTGADIVQISESLHEKLVEKTGNV